MRPPLRLPEGYRAITFPSLDSTNAEALRRAEAGEASGLWVQSGIQSAGRGRQGREWQSREGNLFASLLLRPSCDLGTAQQLAFVAALAVYDAAAALRGTLGDTGLRLKWPNDLLLDGAKIAGILLESTSSPSRGTAIVIGTGLNLAHAPRDTAMPAVALSPANAPIAVSEALAALAEATHDRLSIWSQGEGWERIRQDWMDRGPALGQALRVAEGAGSAEGTYAGLDRDGALLLDLDTGQRRRVLVGDVFLL